MIPAMAFHPEKLLLHPPHLMITTIFLFLIIPCASQLSFNYTDFSQINNGTITMAGNATISGSLIRLTPNAVDNWGRATYSETMHLWEKSTGKVANFTTSFSFIISSEGAGRYSDGLTFFLASPDFPPPFPTDGSGLGLVSREQMRDSSFLAANKFVFVEFDTYPNDRWDPPEPVREHVGININNLTSQKSTTWYSVIKENRTYSCSISYDPSSQNLSVSFTGFSSNDPIPITQHLSSIVDLRDYLPERVEFGFSAGTGLISELHILCSWSFESTAPLLIIQKSPQPQPNKTENESKRGLVVGLSVGASACLLIMGLGLFWLMNRRKNRDRGEGDQDLAFDLSMDDEFEREGTGPKRFAYKELVVATHNFSEEGKLGQGGFGGVYRVERKEEESKISLVNWVWELYGKGRLLDTADDTLNGEYDKEEMKCLMSVGLWCAHPDHTSRPSIRQAIQVLNLEAPLPSLPSHMPVPMYYAPGETTSTQVSFTFTGDGEEPRLILELRYKIVQGLASGLLYLHEEWEQCVVHRDIKSSNMMLDSNFQAKLGDFGLARLVDHCLGSQMTALAGTMGYMAPECFITSKTSKESDVFSFGDRLWEKSSGAHPFPSTIWKLGQGGFGGVYIGFLAEQNMEIVVNKVSSSSNQGKKEYVSEVNTISHLRHRNLVQLVG
ncbi:hypothetical protein FH972_004822 [Carpinus fangiana]|uniref:Protein kinase domain-containing protein n=1 Tax=Carpinus fangiana TaxID=176857 RepID=A0A5N6QPT7_9ROSI|nr:hypothetical protein FH972_004822 [Carpinus fangiana]